MAKDGMKGRRYPRALQVTGGCPPKTLEQKDADSVGNAPGYRTPTIRPGLPVTPVSPPEEVPLDRTAKQVFLGENEEGAQGVSVLIRDDLFENLRCAIDVEADGRVKATFFVKDINLRRLLEAESGRLRDSLEARGLKVRAVAVVVEKLDPSGG